MSTTTNATKATKPVTNQNVKADVKPAPTATVDVAALILASATSLGCTEPQLRIALLTMAKLKNAFSDDLRAYRLASNHVPALKVIIEYIKINNVADIKAMRDVIYCVKKEAGKKAADDATIERLTSETNPILIEPRASQVKVLKPLA